jgi:AcrR family transcriptional regulator
MAKSGPSRARARELVATGLAAGTPVNQIAAANGLTERTIYNWLRESEFRARVNELRNRAVENAISLLASNMSLAAQTLVALLADSTPPANRVQAARTLLEMAFKAREVVEFEERLRAVEERLAQSGSAGGAGNGAGGEDAAAGPGAPEGSEDPAEE